MRHSKVNHYPISGSWQMEDLGADFLARDCAKHFMCVPSFNLTRRQGHKKRFGKDRGRTYPKTVWLQNPWSYHCMIYGLPWKILNFSLESISGARNRLYLGSHLWTIKQSLRWQSLPRSSKWDLKKQHFLHLSLKTFALKIDVC